MSSRMRRPETAVIPISRGDTITVRKHLTSGESRAMVRQMYASHPVTGEIVTGNPVDTGLARVEAYLLDWTITDTRDQPIVIYQQPPDIVRSALDAIEPECYTEILRAIEAHDTAMRADRLEKKTDPAGATTLPSSSASLSVPA